MIYSSQHKFVILSLVFSDKVALIGIAMWCGFCVTKLAVARNFAVSFGAR